MRYKRFAISFILFISIFVGLNFVIWKTVTEDLLTDRHYNGGDLTRMGYLYNSKMLRKNRVDLPHLHVESKDYKGGKIDLVTVGDSFSMGGGGGINPYYQDFIASYDNMRVMNIPAYSASDEEDASTYHFSTILKIANSGYLRSLGVRYVLLQSVERGCIPRFARQYDFSTTEDISKLRSYFASKENILKLPDVPFLNSGNFKFIANSFLYRFSDNAYGKKVYRRELNRSFFSVADDRVLLFLGDEMWQIPKVRSSDIELMNQNLNMLSDYGHARDLINLHALRRQIQPLQRLRC